MRIAIAGASGLLGTALAEALSEGERPGIGADPGGKAAHRVIRLVRRAPMGPGERRWDPAAGSIDGPGAGLDDVDAVVVLSGAGIGDRPWTSGYRREILTSRVDSVRTAAQAMARASASDRPVDGAEPPSSERRDGRRPRTLLVPSAVGIYGAERGDEELTEDSPLGDDFLARVCRLTERAAEPARTVGVRVVALRTGIVLSNAGGYLGLQGLLYRAGLGGPISGGAQWLSWVTRTDHVRAMRHLLLDSDVEGPVDVTAPGAVRQREFARAYAASLHRPAILPLPAGLLVPVLGPDMVAEVVRAGQRVAPRRLLADGFAFRHPELADALAWLPTE